MSVKEESRKTHCNVKIYTELEVASIFQHDDLLRVNDVVHELELCLCIDKPSDHTTLWQPALLSENGEIIFLDQQDDSVFPTPPSSIVVRYDYVYHSASRCNRGNLHHVEDTCISVAPMAKSRRDPRYIAIGKTSINSSLKRSLSSSRDITPSPTRTDHTTDIEIPPIMEIPRGRQVVNGFGGAVWDKSKRGCVITGEGELDGQPCPGIEAAHIVPQSQWNVFPVTDKQDIAEFSNDSKLRYAWERTWSVDNGIMLESTLHKFFDARLISIHPETKKVRAFIDLGLINKHHGRIATLPAGLPKKVLQHHWDMCCLENTPYRFLASATPLTDTPALPPRTQYLRMLEGDPSKQPSNLSTFPFPGESPSGTSSVPGEPPSGTSSVPGGPPSGISSFPGEPPSGMSSFPGEPPSGTSSVPGGKALSSPSHQAITHPPSPPPSEPGVEERTLWSSGKETIEGPGTVQLVEDLNDDEGHGRGRSRKKRRCTASEECGDQGSIWQRLK